MKKLTLNKESMGSLNGSITGGTNNPGSLEAITQCFPCGASATSRCLCQVTVAGTHTCGTCTRVPQLCGGR